MKTAVALFVKDEAHDILTWIVWHKIIGFDTFIICDDGSTDGTASLVEIASKSYDIRLSHSEFPEISFFYYRQEAFYKRVLEDYCDEFDWIAFFDADEYLLISGDISVRDFLGRFSSAGAVAVNWALYGSGGNVLAPRIPTVAAFTSHGDPTDPICTHVKSIVRPKKVGPNWKNVHAFDVADYQNCDSEQFHWGHIPGVTREPPTWANAKLMHFQLRSMEQFVERCKRRPDIKPDRTLFDTLDQNSHQDLRPLRRVPELMGCLRDLIGDFAKVPVADDVSVQYAGDWTAFELATAHGDTVKAFCGDLRAGQVGDSDVIALLSAVEGKCVLLIDEPSAQYSVYHAFYEPVTQSVVLQDTDNLKFLTAVPTHHGGMIMSRAENANTWEVFTAQPSTSNLNSCAALFLSAFNSCSPHLRMFGTKQMGPSPLLLQIAIHTANQNDIARSAKILHELTHDEFQVLP